MCHAAVNFVRRAVSVSVRGEARADVVNYVENNLKCQSLSRGACATPVIPANCVEASWEEFIDEPSAKGFATSAG